MKYYLFLVLPLLYTAFNISPAYAEPKILITDKIDVSPDSVNCSKILSGKTSAIYVQVNGRSISSVDYCDQLSGSPLSSSESPKKMDIMPVDFPERIIPQIITPLNFGKPYFKDKTMVCRETDSGSNLVCLSKDQARQVWGELLK